MTPSITPSTEPTEADAKNPAISAPRHLALVARGGCRGQEQARGLRRRRAGIRHCAVHRTAGLSDGFVGDGADLVLAGHTHGGQIRLPWIGGSKSLTTNCDLENWRSRGVTKVNDEPWLNVSAGMGMSPFAPIRFACPPEVSLITLTA